MKKMVSIGLLLGLVALLAAGCGSSAKNCNDACNKIYDQCRLALKDQNNQDVPKGQCVSTCNAVTTNKQQTIDCIVNAPCVAETLYACLP